MNRFLIQDIKFDNIIKTKNKKLIFQLEKVLRLSIWSKIIFFDWFKNIDYIYEVQEINKKNIWFKFIKKTVKNTELNFDLILYQALPNKTSKIEYIIQKSTEIWFKKIVFFRAERSQKLNITDNKIERFKKIIIEATEQSNRNKILEIKFMQILNNKKIEWINIIMHQEKSRDSIILKDFKINFQNKINIFIWPEWWFSKKELNNFSLLKTKKIFLWNRILRTETAWIVVWFFIIQKFVL